MSKRVLIIAAMVLILMTATFALATSDQFFLDGHGWTWRVFGGPWTEYYPCPDPNQPCECWDAGVPPGPDCAY